jgi:Ala-tRNA(Pro) deacylase
LAKTVIVKVDHKMAMAVLPASYHIDLDKLAKAAGASKVILASEEEFGDLFTGCDVGSMPPFGNLYGLHVFVAKPLPDDEEIAFNAGSHTELVRLPYKDFERLVRPKIADFAVAGVL